jgi:hypothetical protein|tara:strand:+ start:1457 stop:1747 length:291 start_codon:yes stop_codon:yes gene_type:complete
MNLKELGYNFEDVDIPIIFNDIEIDTKYQEYFFNFSDEILNIPLYFFLKDNIDSVDQTKKRGFIKLINNSIKTKKPINQKLLDKFFNIFVKENEYT